MISRIAVQVMKIVCHSNAKAAISGKGINVSTNTQIISCLMLRFRIASSGDFLRSPAFKKPRNSIASAGRSPIMQGPVTGWSMSGAAELFWAWYSRKRLATLGF